MKKRLIGLGIITSMMLSGCVSSGNDNIVGPSANINADNKVVGITPKITSVTQLLPNETVVGWENYTDDTDRDGVLDYKDKCPNTPAGAPVDKTGCFADNDKDGVLDYQDSCLETQEGVEVDKRGCALDNDKDGVADINDKCPNTPEDIKVNFQGCPILAEYRFNFSFDSYRIDKKYYPQIEKLVDVLSKNQDILVEIQGFTDNKGDYLYNKKLSLKRANSLREILIHKFGISPSRIFVTGYGSDYPVASNDTEEGQSQNRRIIVVTKNSFLHTPDTEMGENIISEPIDVDRESDNIVDNTDNIDR